MGVCQAVGEWIMEPEELQVDRKCLRLSLCVVALVKWRVISETYRCEKGLVSVDLTTLNGASRVGP